MLGGPIVFKIAFAAYFAKGESSPAFKDDYFNLADEGLPFEAIAFVLTAIHAAIEEYKLGYWKLSEFTARAYSPKYKQYLDMLQDWHTYTSKPITDKDGNPKQPSRLAGKLRKDLWDTAMESSGTTVIVDNNAYMNSASAEAAFAANELED
ncbi:hypothetical protein FIBSPDRAFT_1049533 [Athelia psychrophila]|nr:hypothetical protein FIBSPDRAFT_1049533 [Fibularhizoctonia sp. CBS 109695]